MGLIVLRRFSGWEADSRWKSEPCDGDEAFVALTLDLPCIYHHAGDCAFVRPADFRAWRAAVAKRNWPVRGRFEWMLDLLESDPGLWIAHS